MSGGGGGTGKPPVLTSQRPPSTPTGTTAPGLPWNSWGAPPRIPGDAYEVPGSRPGSYADAVPPNVYGQMYPGRPYPYASNTSGGQIPNNTSPEFAQQQALAQQQAAGKSYADQLRAQIAAQLTGINTSLSASQAANLRQAGLIQDNDQLQQGYLKAGNSQDIALINNAQGRNVDLARAYAAQQQGLDQGDYDRNVGNLDTLRGFVNTGYGNGMTAAQNSWANTRQQANLSSTNATRATNSDANARGAYGSNGVIQNLTGIADQLGISYKQAGDQYDATKADLGLTRDKGLNDIDQKKGDLDSGLARSNADFAHQNAVYDSLAEQYGIQRDQAKTALERGLQNLGMDSASALNAIAQANASSSVAAQAQAAALMNQATQLGLQAGVPLAGTQKPAIHPSNTANPIANIPGIGRVATAPAHAAASHGSKTRYS